MCWLHSNRLSREGRLIVLFLSLVAGKNCYSCSAIACSMFFTVSLVYRHDLVPRVPSSFVGREEEETLGTRLVSHIAWKRN